MSVAAPSRLDDPDLLAAAQRPFARRSRTARWIVGGVVLLVLVQALVALALNPAFEWDVVGAFLFDGRVLQGLWLTVYVTAIVFVLSCLLGAVLAAMRLSSNPILSAISWAYTWFFRSVPLLVQLVFWFNIGYLFPSIEIGLPFLPPFIEFPTRNLVSSVGVAIIGLTLHEAAYASEIIRGGVLSVAAGQREAATALGLSPLRTAVRIVLPQAMRSILPPLGSMLIGILKATSLVSTIAVADLMSAVSQIYNRTFQVVPLLVVATIWYLVLTSILSVGQWALERRFGRGLVRTSATRRPRLMGGEA